MPGEESHELGREGALRAKALLSRLLGPRIGLPFNAYDNAESLTFQDLPGSGRSAFTFDLGGFLTRTSAGSFAGAESVGVFVEVKNVSRGDALLDDFREFLRRAAVTSAQVAYRRAWFMFIAAVPFGVTKGSELWDGTLVRELSSVWPPSVATAAADLAERVALLMATRSLERLLDRWGAAA